MGWLRRAAVSCALLLPLCLAHSRARAEAVLLDFQTDWCGYCRVMEPVVRELAAEGYHVRTIDGDREPDLVRKFRVQGYPTFVATNDGREIGRVSGQVSKSQLYALLEKAGGKAGSAAGDKVRGQSPDGAANGTPSGGRLPSTGAGAGRDSEGWESAVPLSPPAAAGESIDLDRLVATSVRLRIQDHHGQSVGSGTIIDARDGEALILTCGHVFREFKEGGQILVDCFGPGAPQKVPAVLVSYDLNSDVGLVRMACEHRFVAAKVAPAGSASRAGDSVTSIGCDHGGDATPRVTSVVSVDRYNHAPNLQVAFEPVQGRSGGGLFNRQGHLIGVCNAADATDKQGLFAALAAIHAELDRTRLSFVYQAESGTPIGPLPDRTGEVVEATPAPAELFAAAANLSRDEQTLLEELRRSRGAEVICLVRALDDPRAKSRVLQINRVSPAFWRELAADTTLPIPDHRLTSLQSRLDDLPPGPAADSVTALTARKRPADLRADAARVWPPRSTP